MKLLIQCQTSTVPLKLGIGKWFHPTLYNGWNYSSTMMTSSNGTALLDICAGNSPVTDEFPVQSPVMRSFGVFFDLRLNERLSKQSWGCWFETPSGPLWRHSNALTLFQLCVRMIKALTAAPWRSLTATSLLTWAVFTVASHAKNCAVGTNTRLALTKVICL